MAINNDNIMVLGKIYSNKYGDVKTIQKIDKDHVLIEFVDKNIFGEHTRRIVRFSNIIHSSVKDPYAPIIYGVACKGNAITTINKKKVREYVLWFSMINHTYSSRSKNDSYVCKRWLCYEFFLQDITLIENYKEWFENPGEYSFVKIHGYKEFNLESVMFIRNDLARLVQGHGNNTSTDYLGVTVEGSVFRCTINGESFGKYTNAIAAANMFNIVARYRGYPERVLNKVPYMDMDTIRSYRAHINRKNGKLELIKSFDYRTREDRNMLFGDIGDHIWNNHGDPIRVIRDRRTINGVHRVDVQFLNPNMFGGYTIVENVSFGQITGDYAAVVDYYKPSVYGVACRGYGVSYYDEYGNRSKEYLLWIGIISRCYNPNDGDYPYYGGQGVTVCHRWLCFEFFYQDLPNLINYDKWISTTGEYSIDKDYFQPNTPMYNKVYSPETCLFLSYQDNTAEKQLRLAAENGTGPIGVHEVSPGLFKVIVNGISYGIFNNINAAISMYNMIARQFGRSNEFVNQIHYELPLNKIREHQELPNPINGKRNLCIPASNKSTEELEKEFFAKFELNPLKED